MIDDPLGEVLGHLVAQERRDHFVARDQDVVDVLPLDDVIESIHDFLGVVQVEILDVPLVARLRPAALRGPARLDALDLPIVHDFAGGDHEDACRIRVRHHRGISRKQRFDPRQGVEVRAVADVQPMLVDWSRELDFFEERRPPSTRKWPRRWRRAGAPCRDSG